MRSSISLSSPAIRLATLFFFTGSLLAKPASPIADDKVPWGIASSASSTGTYREWYPKMEAVGIRWARMFAEWNGIENPKGTFHFEGTDAMIAAAAANHINISGLVFGAARWITPSSHTFPMKNLDDWTNYAAAIAAHYKGKIHYWEVWNEGNGGFNSGHNTTADYASLVAAAYTGAKRADPSAQVGISVASYDAAYIDQAVLAQAKMGKPESFDYICIHPYETIGGLSEADGEIPYLWMTRMLRDALKVDAPEKVNAPIWITEIGRHIGNTKESNESDDVEEADAAKTLVKAYVMSIAQGIARICWFEAQDPRGEPPGYGLLRIDGSPRPSYTAMKAMTSHLSEVPKTLGWLALGDGGKGYGFVFKGVAGPALVAWMPLGETDKTITFKDNVHVVDLVTDSSTPLNAGQPLTLTDSPILVTGLPANLAAQAQANAAKSYPWGGDYSSATTASVQLGAPNTNNGVIQVERSWTTPYKFDDGTTGALVSPPGKHDNQNIKFIVHPSYANLKTHEYYIRVTARRAAPPKTPDSYCKLDLVYEVADSRGQGPMRVAGRDMSGPDITTYKGESKGESFTLTDDTTQWQTHTWHLTDACFAKMWGYDFAFLIDKSDPFVIGKVEVSTKPFDD